MKEPTRVASFDELMYGDYLAFSEDMITEMIGSDEDVPISNDDLIQMIDETNEKAEQRIADSHDITKSNFGLEAWQK